MIQATRLKWEYLTLVVGYSGVSGGRVKSCNFEPRENWLSGQTLAPWLVWAGEEGWELVAVAEYGPAHRGQMAATDAQHGDLLYVFKRPGEPS